MELYHIHLLGNHDELYKESTEFIIDRNSFNNRLYDRIYNMNSTVDVDRYKGIVEHINNIYKIYGMPIIENKINLSEVISAKIHGGEGFYDEYFSKILEDANKLALLCSINIQEMAIEEYRKENCWNLPSRLHSLFACSEEGIKFWITRMMNDKMEVFKIEAYDEPFTTNLDLLPNESLNYGHKVSAASLYFNPQEEYLNPVTNEYLIQGKVKMLERVL